MDRHLRALPALAGIALLAHLTGTATAQDASVTLMKTVGTVPNQCAAGNFLAEVPPDGIVYYCYKMTNTGAITVSSSTLIDSALGNILNNIPGGRCCTDASGADCKDPTDICTLGVNSCSGMYPVCVATTYPGVCCANMFGNENNCFIPHLPCEDDINCPGQKCVTNPIVGPGQMAIRVITATVPSGGIANVATWTAQTGICCSDSPDSCDGVFTPKFCSTDGDCVDPIDPNDPNDPNDSNEQIELNPPAPPETCRTSGIGLCCNPDNPGSCNKVCLSGRDCAPNNNDPNNPGFPDPFTECVVMDTGPAQDTAGARVAVFSDTPVMSAGAMALVILMLVGIGLRRLRERDS